MKKTMLVLLFATCASLADAQVPEEYTITVISGWTSNQLATLPYFDRYVPLAPAGASGDFVPVARSGLGVAAGKRDPNDTLGAYVHAVGQTNIPAWGTYHWSYRIWDGNHWDYYSGNITHSQAADVNVLGQIIGNATLSGSGNSSLDYDDHTYLRDTTTGAHLDLTPDAHRAALRGINDLGEITGRWWTTNVSHAVRRLADGTEFDFTSPGGTVYPEVINNRGVIAGTVTTYGFPWTYSLFVSEAGTNKTVLPYPDQGNPENGDIYDINDHGIIVGSVHKGSGVEPLAARWRKNGGSWVGEDLNEMRGDDETYLIDRAIAVNDAGHIIAKGHPDGTDVIGTHTLLLTPLVFPAPSVITLAAADVGPTSVVLRAKVNACNSSTTLVFEHGETFGYGSVLPITGTFTGTVPVLVSAELTGLSPHTTYHYRGQGTNAVGTTDGEDIIFTTPYDYAAWAAEQFGTNVANPEIAGMGANPDGDASVNFVEYALGGMALVSDNPATMPSMVDGDEFVTGFVRPTDRSGVAYVVEQATELAGPWTDAEVVGVMLNPDGTETVAVRSMSAVSAEPIQFMRLRISMQ